MGKNLEVNAMGKVGGRDPRAGSGGLQVGRKAREELFSGPL